MALDRVEFYGKSTRIIPEDTPEDTPTPKGDFKVDRVERKSGNTERYLDQITVYIHSLSGTKQTGDSRNQSHTAHGVSKNEVEW